MAPPSPPQLMGIPPTPPCGLGVGWDSHNQVGTGLQQHAAFGSFGDTAVVQTCLKQGHASSHAGFPLHPLKKTIESACLTPSPRGGGTHWGGGGDQKG